MICLNNPNNPTGSLIPKDMMEEIVDIAREAGAYLFCDEVYAGVSQREEDRCPSVADLYEKGIATGSMSKAFSWQDSVWAGWPQRMRKHWLSSGG